MPVTLPRYAANLGFLFADRPLLARVEAAAAAGFPAIELHWPYDVPGQELRAAIARAGVTMLGLNTAAGEVARGEFGLGAVPGAEARFQASVDQALDYGQLIGATAIHAMAGRVPPGVSLASASRTFVLNLRLASEKAARAGLKVLIEPINHRDQPEYFLTGVEQAAAIIEMTGRRNIHIQFDCYHVQISQGDLITRITRHLPLIGHVQVAAVPSRAEPDEGEINYAAVLAALAHHGYGGFIGAEYKPRAATEAGLAWRGRLAARMAP